MTLTEFLLARIAADEAKADDEFSVLIRRDDPETTITVAFDTSPAMPESLRLMGTHDQHTAILRFRERSTERVLAECAARRAIVELHQELKVHGHLELHCQTCREDDYPCSTLRRRTPSTPTTCPGGGPDDQHDHALAHDAGFSPAFRTACRHDADPHRGHNATSPTCRFNGDTQQKHGPADTRTLVASSSDSVRMWSARTW